MPDIQIDRAALLTVNTGSLSCPFGAPPHPQDLRGRSGTVLLVMCTARVQMAPTESYSLAQSQSSIQLERLG